MNPSIRIALVLASFTFAHGCSPQASLDSPAGTVAVGIDFLESNNVKGFVETLVTDAQYRELATEWTEVTRTEATPEQVTEWRTTMKKLTGPGAEAKMMAEITPQLEAMRPQWEMMVGFFSGMAEAGLDQSAGLSDKERKQAKKAIESLVAWTAENDVTSVDKAREAVAAICKTARRLDLPEYSDLQAMHLDEALIASQTLLDGVKDVLDVYGVSVNDMLGTVDVDTLNETADWALLEISFQFLGSEQSFETEMVRHDGRWVSKAVQERESLLPTSVAGMSPTSF